MQSKNKTDIALLGLLLDGPKSGYEIKLEIEERLSHFWSESFGNIYPRLKVLQQGGFLHKELVPQSGRPNKHLYLITPSGRQAIRDWFSADIKPVPARNEMLLKVFLGKHAAPGVLASQLEKYRQECASYSELYRYLETALEKEREGNPDYLYWLITLKSGQHTVGATLDWIDEALSMLKATNSES